MKRRRWIFMALAVLAIAGLGFGFWQTGQASGLSLAQATPTESAYQTATVHTGSLTVSISGTGNVVTSQSVDLAFPVSGTVATLNVQLGDTVKTGQVLAVLDGTDALKQAVQQQQVAVQSAEKALKDLANTAQQSLAQALLDQATAQAAYVQAQANLRTPGQGRCEQQTTEKYYYDWLDLQKPINYWQSALDDPHTGYGRDYILQNLNPLLKKSYIAWANYSYCQTFTPEEVSTSQANLQMTKAKYDQATRTYQALKAASGVDTTQMEIAQATLANAQLQLLQAQKYLDGATLTAPIDGIVTALNGAQGDAVGTGVFISIASQDNLQVQVTIDESDLENFAVGCPAVVSFDSLKGQTFSGKVSQVSPTMSSTSSSSANGQPAAASSSTTSGSVQGLVALDKSKALSGKPLPFGLPATVEITCSQETNVLLVAAQGIYQPVEGTPYVYVLNAQGQPEKREVQLGLRTVALAEVKGGLKDGDKVIISQVESK